MNENIKEVAIRLAEANSESEEKLVKVYLFPHETEIRLIELDESMVASEEVTPYYFAPTGDITCPSGIAVIRPEEYQKLDPPEGWGGWDEAELIWSRDEEDTDE